MSTFDERKKAHENKFVHDMELEFKIRSRRNKLFGKWVAEKMHLSESDVELYALNMLEVGIDDSDSAKVLEKAMADLEASGVAVEEKELLSQLEKLSMQVRDELGIASQ